MNPFYTQWWGAALNIGMRAAGGDGECRARYLASIDASGRASSDRINRDGGY
jgi:hypothetical protein